MAEIREAIMVDFVRTPFCRTSFQIGVMAIRS